MGTLLPLVVRFDNITSCVVEIKQATYLTKRSLEPMPIWLFIHSVFSENWVCRGHDRMVVGFITAYAISAYHHLHCEFESRSGEVYWIQHYVIKFVSDLWQVGGFLR